MTETKKNTEAILKLIEEIIGELEKDNLSKAESLFDNLEKNSLLSDDYFLKYDQLSVLFQMIEGFLWDSGAKILGLLTLDEIKSRYLDLLEEIEEQKVDQKVINYS